MHPLRFYLFIFYFYLFKIQNKKNKIKAFIQGPSPLFGWPNFKLYIVINLDKHDTKSLAKKPLPNFQKKSKELGKLETLVTATFKQSLLSRSLPGGL